MSAREDQFLEYVQSGGQVETTDWMPDDYRAKLIKFIEMHGNSELMGVLPERDWILRAPTLQRKLALTAKIQDEVGHAQLIYRVVERGRTVTRDRDEQLLLRLRQRVERALLNPHRRREIGHRRAVVATLGEEPGGGVDELADRFTAIVVDGIRGYATPS